MALTRGELLGLGVVGGGAVLLLVGRALGAVGWGSGKKVAVSAPVESFSLPLQVAPVVTRSPWPPASWSCRHAASSPRPPASAWPRWPSGRCPGACGSR